MTSTTTTKENKLQIKQNTLDEILNDISNSRFENLKHLEGKVKDYYSCQIRAIGDYFYEKKYYQYLKNNDDKMQLDLSRKCKRKVKQPELHTQISFIEKNAKNLFVPRDLLISYLEEDSVLVKNMKKYSNRMEINVRRLGHKESLIDIFYPGASGGLEVSELIFARGKISVDCARYFLMVDPNFSTRLLFSKACK